MDDRCEAPVAPLADALAVFRAMGIDVSSMSRAEFKRTYYRLAMENQNRADSHDLMAHINLARASINKLHRWTIEDDGAADLSPSAGSSETSAPAANDTLQKRRGGEQPPPAHHRAASETVHRSSEDEYRKTRALLDRIIERRNKREATFLARLNRKLRTLFLRDPLSP